MRIGGVQHVSLVGGLLGLRPLIALRDVALGPGPIEKSSAEVGVVALSLVPLQSLAQGEAVLALHLQGVRVRAVQASNLSWLGYPQDTEPSSRDFLPGLSGGQRGEEREEEGEEGEGVGEGVANAGVGVGRGPPLASISGPKLPGSQRGGGGGPMGGSGGQGAVQATGNAAVDAGSGQQGGDAGSRRVQQAGEEAEMLGAGEGEEAGELRERRASHAQASTSCSGSEMNLERGVRWKWRRRGAAGAGSDGRGAGCGGAVRHRGREGVAGQEGVRLLGRRFALAPPAATAVGDSTEKEQQQPEQPEQQHEKREMGRLHGQGQEQQQQQVLAGDGSGSQDAGSGSSAGRSAVWEGDQHMQQQQQQQPLSIRQQQHQQSQQQGEEGVDEGEDGGSSEAPPGWHRRPGTPQSHPLHPPTQSDDEWSGSSSGEGAARAKAASATDDILSSSEAAGVVGARAGGGYGRDGSSSLPRGRRLHRGGKVGQEAAVAGATVARSSSGSSEHLPSSSSGAAATATTATTATPPTIPSRPILVVQPYVQSVNQPSIVSRAFGFVASRAASAFSEVLSAAGRSAASLGQGLAVHLPPVHLGLMTLSDGSLQAVIWGEPIPRTVEEISATARLARGYSRFDLDLEGIPRARDPRSVKCTVTSPHAKRHLRHVTPGAVPQGVGPLRQFTCDVLPALVEGGEGAWEEEGEGAENGGGVAGNWRSGTAAVGVGGEVGEWRQQEEFGRGEGRGRGVEGAEDYQRQQHQSSMQRHQGQQQGGGEQDSSNQGSSSLGDYVTPEPLRLGPTGQSLLDHTVHFQRQLLPSEAAAYAPCPGSGGRLRVTVNHIWPKDPNGSMDLSIGVFGRALHAPLLDRLVELPMDVNEGTLDGEFHIRAYDDVTWDFPAMTGKVACSGGRG